MKFGGFAFEDVNVLIPQMPEKQESTYESGAESMMDANMLEIELNDINAASYVGTLVAKRALEKGIDKVVFDRCGFLYKGKIQALADAAREAGLQF